MDLLGYSFSYEFVTKGHRYHYGKIAVDIFQVFKVTRRFQADGLEPLVDNDDWVVQASVVETSQDQVASWSYQLFQLASHIQNIFSLRVVDHICLQSKINYKNVTR
jgi:hypothetical protein